MSTLFNLHVGDVIKMEQGCGLVPLEAQTQSWIVIAAKNYAITDDGTVLTEKDRRLHYLVTTAPGATHDPSLAQAIQALMTRPKNRLVSSDDGDKLG